ncbi:MAG: hypothetical protein LBC20_03170 [Planctomycetaceae bacterium]|jgi:hypothetical protein|nr:hypothetical protein [Planctomycetaceae bacterium]
MKTLRIITVLLLSLTTSVSAFSDEAFDFFVETSRHSGYNPAEISTFQATLKATTQSVYPDSVAKSRKQQMADRINATFRENDEAEKNRLDSRYDPIR